MVFPRTGFLKFAYNLAQDVHTTRSFMIGMLVEDIGIVGV
jgi:hypothetical protein